MNTTSWTRTEDGHHGSPVQDPESLRFLLALHRAPGVGAVRFQQLMETFGSPHELFRAGSVHWQRCGLSAPLITYLKNPDWRAVDEDLRWLSGSGNHVLSRQDRAYPALLEEIADPPALLFVHGDIDALSQPQLAIVGSRNPSHEGAVLAREFAAYLASCGLSITSGLATGIDAAAHRGAIKAGGVTLAVTGTGLDRVYPASHRELAHEITVHGALISEFPPGTAPQPANFPRRNRIISGLSLGTLVVEAALRSGSLITARLALEQGREVFAIPGSIHNPLARGCHALIREGAKLVETGDHIFEELTALVRLTLNPQDARYREEQAVDASARPGILAPEYVQLLESMGFDPVSVDQLVARNRLTPEEVSSMLLVLELDDYIVSSAGGRYTRTRKRA